MKTYNIKTSCVSPEVPNVITIHDFSVWLRTCLIQWILIGFESILGMNFLISNELPFCMKLKWLLLGGNSILPNSRQFIILKHINTTSWENMKD